MPPESDIVLKFVFGFTAAGLMALVTLMWNTRELVKDMHSTINNKHSGIDAIWAAINGLRKDFTALERRASPPVDADA